MSATATRFLLPVLLTATTAVAAAAQQSTCDVKETTPKQVTQAYFQVNLAQQAQMSQKPAEAAKQLQQAVKQLTDNPDKIDNPLGRDLVLGKALTLWLNQPDIGYTATRGQLGYTTDPTGTIDIIAAIDTAFGAVEKAQPGCIPTTAPYRAQKPWLNLVNAAIAQYNEEHLDSAATLARRSIQLYTGSPYGEMILGNVAQRRGQNAEAIEHYKLSVAAAKGDTTYNEARRQILITLGNTASEAANNATGAQKTQFQQEAKNAYNEVLAEQTTGQYADQAHAGLARLAQASGDTAAVKASYSGVLNNASSATFQQLLSAGVTAAQTNQAADAMKLFEAAYQKDPYHRDVLSNLAIVYVNGKQADKALPLVQRLLAVEPTNPDNFRLAAAAYADMQAKYNDQIKQYNAKLTASKSKTAQKAYSDSAKASLAMARAVTDSALRYAMVADSLPVTLKVTSFIQGGDTASLGGTITNHTKAPQSYTVNVSFLDVNGQTVATKSVSVGPVAPGQSANFTAEGTGAGIVAFKYAPLYDWTQLKMEFK